MILMGYLGVITFSSDRESTVFLHMPSSGVIQPNAES